MQQSNVIFANLFIAYFLFVTMKGELPSYITLLRGGGQQASGAGSGAGSVNGIISGAQSDLANATNLPPPQAGAVDFLTQLTQ